MTETIRLPCHALYVRWEFTSPVEVMEWDLGIRADPGTSVGEYLALFNGSIDGSQFYLGLQTDVFHPELGRGVGKGLIFSTWWSFDESDLRIAEAGFVQVGTHEGRFIGVRLRYDWSAGEYRVTLERKEADPVGKPDFDWFDLYIQPIGGSDPSKRGEPTGSKAWVGGIRFPRAVRHKAAAIDRDGTLFLEVYSNASTWADVSRWSVDVMAYGDGVRCPSGRTEYARFPHDQEMPNANVRYDPIAERVEVSFGVGVTRLNAPERWASHGGRTGSREAL